MDLANTINVTELVDSRKMTGVQIRVVLLCALIILLDGFDLIVISVAASWGLKVGITIAQVGLAIALNSIGSVIGSGAVGRLMDKLGVYPVLMSAFLAAAVATALFGFVVSSFAQAAVLITPCGVSAGASQAGVIALSTLMYPVAVRSTGVGWGIAMGRLGGTLSPLVGGVLHWLELGR